MCSYRGAEHDIPNDFVVIRADLLVPLGRKPLFDCCLHFGCGSSDSMCALTTFHALTVCIFHLALEPTRSVQLLSTPACRSRNDQATPWMKETERFVAKGYGPGDGRSKIGQSIRSPRLAPQGPA